MKKLVYTMLFGVILSGCASFQLQDRHGEGQYKEIRGPDITQNVTSATPLLMCVGDHVNSIHIVDPGKYTRYLRIAIGEINDATGKYTYKDGYAVSQGGRSMVTSAVARTSSFGMVERQYLSVAEYDKAMTFGSIPVGSMKTSDFYITGSITEMNYNIFSGGTSLDIAGIGGKRRTYVASVAVDLRIINTRTSEIVKAISLQKQLLGHETTAGIFKFTGKNNLFDFGKGESTQLVDGEIGTKRDEPLGLALRTILEQGTAELLGYIYKVPVSDYRLLLADPTDDELQNPRVFANQNCSSILPAPSIITMKDVVKQKVTKRVIVQGACGINNMPVEPCDCELAMSSPLFDGTIQRSSAKPRGFYIQTATHTSRNRALNERNCLESGKKTMDLFADTGYIVEKQGKHWPVKTGPFETKAEATKMCADSQALGLQCFVLPEVK